MGARDLDRRRRSARAVEAGEGAEGAGLVGACALRVTQGERGAGERARGGAVNLAAVLTRNPGGVGGTRFFPGINDPFAPGFDNISLTIYDPWESDVFPATDKTELTRNRGDIGDGANLFYTKPITITNVPGLNDVLGQPAISGFCTTCHNTPDVGNHSRPRFMNTGTLVGSLVFAGILAVVIALVIHLMLRGWRHRAERPLHRRLQRPDRRPARGQQRRLSAHRH